jgi:glucose/arabinose dehydrogenase
LRSLSRARRRRGAVVVIAAVFASVCASPVGAATSHDGLFTIGAGLRGVRGLEATVYAIGLRHVSAFAEDPHGQLWVATADALDEGDDGVYLVSSEGASPSKVITDVHTPLGLLWHQGALVVSSASRVDSYSNFDGTRFAEQHTIVSFPAGTGENNGLALSPDGRLVLGISAPCDSCKPTSPWSASIVSFRPDGTDLRVDASGIRAPIGLSYYPGTSDLFATMNQRDDLGARTPGDWLALVRPGQVWGFPVCYGQRTAACTNVPRPTAVLDRHAAVSGVAIVTGQLGTSVATSALVAEWNKGIVLRVRLKRRGSSYSAQVRPFLIGFRNPMPLLSRSSGATLVGDWTTGKVYSITSTAPRVSPS